MGSRFGVQVLNELLSKLNQHRDLENRFLPPEEQLKPFQTTDVIDIINKDPSALTAIIDDVRNTPDTFIGEKIGTETSTQYLQDLHDDW